MKRCRASVIFLQTQPHLGLWPHRRREGKPKAKLRLYIGDNVELRLDIALSLTGERGKSTVKPHLDRAANLEPELCLRLALASALPSSIRYCPCLRLALAAPFSGMSCPVASDYPTF
jgi:hypothetical protein